MPRAFFDEGGRRLYVARTYARRNAGDANDGLATGVILAGQASLVARFPGSGLNGRAILRQRELPAAAVVLDRAPIGTLVRTGGATPAGPAVLTGGTAPFALADGATLTLVLPGGNRDITFQGAPAVVEGAAVADPANVNIPGGPGRRHRHGAGLSGGERDVSGAVVLRRRRIIASVVARRTTGRW